MSKFENVTKVATKKGVNFSIESITYNRIMIVDTKIDKRPKLKAIK